MSKSVFQVNLKSKTGNPTTKGQSERKRKITKRKLNAFDGGDQTAALVPRRAMPQTTPIDSKQKLAVKGKVSNAFDSIKQFQKRTSTRANKMKPTAPLQADIGKYEFPSPIKKIKRRLQPRKKDLLPKGTLMEPVKSTKSVKAIKSVLPSSKKLKKPSLTKVNNTEPIISAWKPCAPRLQSVQIQFAEPIKKNKKCLPKKKQVKSKKKTKEQAETTKPFEGEDSVMPVMKENPQPTVTEVYKIEAISSVKCDDIKCEDAKDGDVKCDVIECKEEKGDVKCDVIECKDEKSEIKCDVIECKEEKGDVKCDVIECKEEKCDVKCDVIECEDEKGDVIECKGEKCAEIKCQDTSKNYKAKKCNDSKCAKVKCCDVKCEVEKCKIIKPVNIKTSKKPRKQTVKTTEPAKEVKPVQNPTMVKLIASKETVTDSEPDSWICIRRACKNKKFHPEINRFADSSIVIKDLLQDKPSGEIYLAFSKILKQNVVLRTINKSLLENEEQTELLRKVLKMHAALKHPHILRTYKVYESSRQFLLVLEHAAGGTLFDKLKKRSLKSEKDMQQIFRQIAAAIFYAHHSKVTHGCLRLEDIYLDKKHNVKVANFGLCRVLAKDNLRKTFCGSQSLYASPESVTGIRYYGSEVDCWALGVILYAMAYSKMPFRANNENDVSLKILTSDYRNSGRPAGVANLIWYLLMDDRRHRFNITKVCSHWWMDNKCPQPCLKWAQTLAHHRKLPSGIIAGLKVRERSKIHKPIKTKSVLNFTDSVKILECCRRQGVEARYDKSNKLKIKIPTPRNILAHMNLVTSVPMDIKHATKEMLAQADLDQNQFPTNVRRKFTFKQNDPLFKAIEEFNKQRAILKEKSVAKRKPAEEQAKKVEIVKKPTHSVPNVIREDYNQAQVMMLLNSRPSSKQVVANQGTKYTSTRPAKNKSKHDNAMYEIQASAPQRPVCVLHGFDEHVVKLKNLAEPPETSKYIFQVDDYFPKTKPSPDSLAFMQSRKKASDRAPTRSYQLNRYL